jgi:hypothetical protein
MANVETTIKDQASSALIAVEGIAVTSTPANPTTGQVLRQAMAIGDGAGATNWAQVDSNNNLHVVQPTIGIGTFALVPTNGTTTTPVFVSAQPVAAVGIELYLPAGSSINANIAASSSAAATQIAATIVPVYDNTSLGKIVQINIGTGLNLWVSAVTGTPYFRWI